MVAVQTTQEAFEEQRWRISIQEGPNLKKLLKKDALYLMLLLTQQPLQIIYNHNTQWAFVTIRKDLADSGHLLVLIKPNHAIRRNQLDEREFGQLRDGRR